MDLVVCFLILIATLIAGFPIPFCFFGAIAWMVFYHGYDPTMLLSCGYHFQSSVILLAMPLFILFGTLIEKSGVADILVDFVQTLLGRVKGGLGVVAVATSGIFGAMSGAASPSVCAIGTMMIPRMEREGYPRGYAAALISSSALLSLIIPPSMLQILYGFVTETSVASCFLAIVGPGLMMVVILSILNMWMVRSMPIMKAAPLAVGFWNSAKKVAVSTWRAFPALLLPIIILGGIYGGVFTPTESAAVGVVCAVLVGGLIYRGLNFRVLIGSLKTAGVTSGVVLVMVFFAIILGRIFVLEHVPQQITAFILSVTTSKYLVLLMVNVLLIILGMIMEDGSACILAAPLLLPLMKEIGVSPVHFAAIIGVNLGMGCITPPVAPVLYLGSRIGNVGVDKMFKPIFIFIALGWLPGVLITTYWPELSLFLPRLLGFL